MSGPHISVVVNAHHEGLIAVPSIRSLALAASYAARRGVRVETIALLDCSNDLTADVFATHADHRCEIVRVDIDDLGLCRNHGAQLARGDYVAFLDADDLWSENWLMEAFLAAEGDDRMVVWHPEANLYFGAATHIYRHVDMDSTEFDPLNLMITNYWTALCFTRRTLVIEMPYRTTDLSSGIGYEDWSWNQEIIARGGMHKTVRGTAHGIRVRQRSLLRMTMAAASIPHPTDMYRNMLMRRLKSAATSIGNSQTHSS
ncbi:glycosyltransferase family A protein [uncultured Thiodictyon sp.]|uniref:glycosyltransferase family 2 protein n=1 Tax=uncultured Thiodictyon sp. TaxID=1846217 RepID=UPI0025EB695D|nr:glycosyltransferase family A protein [uncultured Thiodictyon sp.]